MARERPRPAVTPRVRRNAHPYPRDHPARPGIKLEPPQAAGRPWAVPAAGQGQRPRTNDLNSRRLSSWVIVPLGEAIGRTRPSRAAHPTTSRSPPAKGIQEVPGGGLGLLWKGKNQSMTVLKKATR